MYRAEGLFVVLVQRSSLVLNVMEFIRQLIVYYDGDCCCMSPDLGICRCACKSQSLFVFLSEALHHR